LIDPGLSCHGGWQEEALKKYFVHLTGEERSQLLTLTRKGRASARRLRRALVLLAADDGNKDDQIVQRTRVSLRTVESLRRRFVEEGLEAALSDRPRPGKAPLLDGRQQAYLVALTCSTPPPGRAQWTMQLLADKLVELRVVDGISDETVRRTLKRGTSNPGSFESGAFPA
jgi:transposase